MYTGVVGGIGCYLAGFISWSVLPLVFCALVAVAIFRIRRMDMCPIIGAFPIYLQLTLLQLFQQLELGVSDLSPYQMSAIFGFSAATFLLLILTVNPVILMGSEPTPNVPAHYETQAVRASRTREPLLMCVGALFVAQTVYAWSIDSVSGIVGLATNVFMCVFLRQRLLSIAFVLAWCLSFLSLPAEHHPNVATGVTMVIAGAFGFVVSVLAAVQNCKRLESGGRVSSGMLGASEGGDSTWKAVQWWGIPAHGVKSELENGVSFYGYIVEVVSVLAIFCGIMAGWGNTENGRIAGAVLAVALAIVETSLGITHATNAHPNTAPRAFRRLLGILMLLVSFSLPFTLESQTAMASLVTISAVLLLSAGMTNYWFLRYASAADDDVQNSETPGTSEQQV
eukprot:GFYU01009315.1.p1 GENE.GFYU01009315.1~~GFYU01009315.1.p1  ORF type:complete len:430 (-),score=112.73 GFYU01009315.1:91-1278(-)